MTHRGVTPGHEWTAVRFSHERPPKQDDLEVIASGVDQAQFPPFSRETAGETLSAMKIEVPYHVLHDFEPISVLTTSPLWILGKNDLPAKDLKELIAWLKANPDKASVATVGAGSASHMCMVYFQDATGTRFQYVPYRGAAPVIQDLIAGQVDLS